MSNKVLTTRQFGALRALLECDSIIEAAKRANVAETSIYNWLKDETFLAELQAAEKQIIDAAIRVLVADMFENIKVMRSVRDDQSNSATVRLRAAKSLDDSLLKWRELATIESRVYEIERLIYAR
jgi:hypothetical protein